MSSKQIIKNNWKLCNQVPPKSIKERSEKTNKKLLTPKSTKVIVIVHN